MLNFGYSRKTLHELSRLFVEYVRHVAKDTVSIPRPNSFVLGTVNSRDLF